MQPNGFIKRIHYYYEKGCFPSHCRPDQAGFILLIAVHAMTPNAIAEHFDITRQAVSKHLRILSECQLVKQEQSGREIYYQLHGTKMKDVDKWLDQFKKVWESRFDELDTVLSTLKSTRK